MQACHNGSCEKSLNIVQSVRSSAGIAQSTSLRPNFARIGLEGR